MAHLFFSYAHTDYDRLIAVSQRMELVTERMIWVDRIGLQRDAEWAAMIQRAVQSSDGVIFAVTKEFVTRPFILEKEIPWTVERFNDSRQCKLIFPILFDDVPLPDQLIGPNVQFCKQVIDARDGDYERVIQELKKALPPASGQDYPFLVSWPRLPNFKGRDGQLVKLHNAMHTEDGKAMIRTAGMVGMVGIGKTQLAIEFVHRYRFYFPAGIYWLNAADVNWKAQIESMADRLRLQPADPTAPDRAGQMAAAFNGYLQEKTTDGSVLIVLDNVEYPPDVANREIGPGGLKITDLPARILITTRRDELPKGFEAISVATLRDEPDAARAILLTARPGETDTAALTAICERLGYLPLALGLAAAALAKRPKMSLTAFIKQLEQGIDQLAKAAKIDYVDLNVPAHYIFAVDAALDWHWAQLEDDNTQKLITLSAAYGEAAIIPYARLRLLMDMPDDPDSFDQPFDDAITSLHRDNLIEDAGRAALRLHPLVREYVRRKMPDFPRYVGEAAESLTHAYRTPDVLVQETLARGFEAVLNDLRETLPAVSVDRFITGPLAELSRYFEWEGHHLRTTYPAENPDHDKGLSLIQHLRERAHHQGTDSILRDDCDRWLEAHRLPHFRSHDAWRHPNDPALIRIFEGHSESVNAVAFSLDGRTALSGSSDGTLRLWDVSSGVELRVFEGHRAAVIAVAFAPDGRTALSGSRDKTLRLWDISSGVELRRFGAHSNAIYAVAFAPDGRTALSGSYRETFLWDMSNGAELRRFEGHRAAVIAVAFAPDSRTALSGSYRETFLWDMSNGAELRRFEGHRAAVNAVAFVPDSRNILSGSSDGTLRLWDVSSGVELRRFEGHIGPVNAVAFAPDGRTALSGAGGPFSSDTTLRLWDVSSGVELRRFGAHSNTIYAVAFAPDGRTALSGSEDETLRLWDISSGVELRRFGAHSNAIYAVAFAPDGRTALSGSDDNMLRLWDMSNGAELRRFEGQDAWVIAVAFAPDSRTALSGSDDKTLRLWDLSSGTVLRRFEGHIGPVNAVAFAPDGRTALSGSEDETLRLWDISSGVELRRFEGHIGPVNAVAFAPDGRTALSGSDDHTLWLWDISSGVELRRFVGHSASIHAVAFAPDGRTALSSSDDATLRLWNVNSGKSLVVLRLEAPISTLAVAAKTPPLVMIGDTLGGLWVFWLHIP